MCSPGMVASLAAQGAGIAIQNSAARRAEDARATALDENTKRQRLLEDEARMAMYEPTSAMEKPNFDASIADVGDQLANTYDAATGQAVLPAFSPSSGNSPRIVQDVIDAAVGAAEAKRIEDNQKLAELNSVNQYLRGTIDPMLRDSASVGAMTGNFVRGNSAPLTAELDAANRKGYSPVAQLLIGAGKTGMNYGLKKV